MKPEQHVAIDVASRANALTDFILVRGRGTNDVNELFMYDV